MMNSCAGELSSSTGRAVIGDGGRGVTGLRGAVTNERGDDGGGDITLSSSGLEGILTIVTDAAIGLGYSAGVSRRSFSLGPFPVAVGGAGRVADRTGGVVFSCSFGGTALSRSLVGPLNVSNRARVGLLEVEGGIAERGGEGVSEESVLLVLVLVSGVRPGWCRVGGMSIVEERRGERGGPGEVVGGSNSGIGLCLAATSVRSWNRPFWDPDRLVGVGARGRPPLASGRTWIESRKLTWCSKSAGDSRGAPSTSISRSPETMRSSPRGSLRMADMPPRRKYTVPGINGLKTDKRVHAMDEEPEVEGGGTGASGSISSISSS